MKSTIFSIFLVFVILNLFAQETVLQQAITNRFKAGKQLFEEKQYAAAIEQLDIYLADTDQPEGEVIEASFYRVISALMLKDKTAETQLSNFINKYPESYYGNQALFYLANFKYSQKNFRYAGSLYSKVKINQLSKNQLKEYQFKKGYCHFDQEQYTEAEDLFYEVKQDKNLYREAAIYYYAHIQYEEGNYSTALDNFLMLENSPQYEAVVPYYLVQLYHLNKEYDKVIKLGSNLIMGTVNNRTAEISRIVGDAYYARQEYEKSIAFLERYQEETPSISRPDIYHLGVAYYNTKQYDKAIEAFSQMATKEDELSQSAYGYLGDCYLKLDDKKSARMAFEAASRMEFDKSLQEEALYNFSKLTYETAYSPFNEIIVAFETFLEQFPQSKYRDEVYNMLSNVFLSTQNYERAYQSILKIKTRDSRVLRALQRVAYYRGIELITNNRYAEAIKYFDTALENGSYDKVIKALTYYWRGESYYRLNEYEKALSDLNKFILSPGAYGQDVFDMAHYNMGYAYFKKKNYSAAINWFRKFIDLAKTKDKNILTDANNRVGDCYYLKRDFKDAVNYYTAAYNAGGSGADYAMYKKGHSYGLQKKYENKISTLKQLISEFTTSRFLDDAWFEMGKTWVLLNEPNNAIGSYNALIQKFPNSAFTAEAMLNMALVYYNIQNIDQASDIYKDVVSKYPSSDASRSALAALKNISVEKNKVDEYIDYTKKVGGFASLKNNEEDSLTFVAAEKLYMSGNLSDSKEYLQNYINKFPQGLNVLTAHFYKADCHLRLNEKDAAIDDLKFIVKQHQNEYTEQALAALTSILFNNKNYTEALEYYSDLLEVAQMSENIKAAKIGVMRCQYNLQNAGAAILAADDILNEAVIEPELKREAMYKKAKMYMQLDNKVAALEIYKELSGDTRSAEGAEAKYLVSKIQYNNRNYEASEATIFEFIGMNTPHQYWLAKAFILLSDIYIHKDDMFQAKQYLLSVKENYTANDDIRPEVETKLKAIDALEKQKELQKRDTLKMYFQKVEAEKQMNTDSIK